MNVLPSSVDTPATNSIHRRSTRPELVAARREALNMDSGVLPVKHEVGGLGHEEPVFVAPDEDLRPVRRQRESEHLSGEPEKPLLHVDGMSGRELRRPVSRDHRNGEARTPAGDQAARAEVDAIGIRRVDVADEDSVWVDESKLAAGKRDGVQLWPLSVDENRKAVRAVPKPRRADTYRRSGSVLEASTVVTMNWGSIGAPKRGPVDAVVGRLEDLAIGPAPAQSPAPPPGYP